MADEAGLLLLVVDDDRWNRNIARRLLESLGHRVHLVENGQVALAWLRENSCDLILMDCAMPVMGGCEATRAIRRGDAGDAHIDRPVVALSAHGMTEDRRRCLEAGMNEHLTKPAGRYMLSRAIAKFFPEASGSGSDVES